MAGVWDKLDAYTKSDYLNSSDEENQNGEFEQLLKRTSNPRITTENSLKDKDCSDEDIEVEQSGDLHNNLLNEMRESQLHCDAESRNIQEKIDEIASDKRNQKGELSEMHHKAQLISKSARMSATEVLSTITNSETMDIEDNSQMGEYLNKIRSVQTESNQHSEQPSEPEPKIKSSSSDIDLPDIPPVSVVLNTGVMKSRVQVARQGSMKTRRKPTTRRSWTTVIQQAKLQKEEENKKSTEESGESSMWILSQSGDDSTPHRSGSATPSDSSSEEEKEVSKPHLKSGVALPGLWDKVKIQLQRSELKHPTALNIVKSAKDAKENEVTKEDKPDVPAPKPDWMKEVERRKKNPKETRRKHVTLPGRCSELDKLFEQRNKDTRPEGLGPQVTQDDGEIARETSRPRSQHGIDPQLSKLLEKRRQLEPMEGNVGQVREPVPRPKSLHLEENKPSELDKIFEKRNALGPVEDTAVEGELGKVSFPKPRSFQGDSRTDWEVVHSWVHNGHGKLEPLPAQTKEAKISEIPSEDSHKGRPSSHTTQVNKVVQFTIDEKDGSRAMIGRIPPSGNQATSSQAGQVAQVGQFTPDGKAGSQAKVGRIPSAGRQRPPSRLGYNVEDEVTPVVAKYEDQPVVKQSAGSGSAHTFSPQGKMRPTPDRPRSNQWTPNTDHSSITPSRGDTRNFTDQGKSRINGRVRPRDKSVEHFGPATEPTRHVYSKTIQYPENHNYPPPNPPFHGNVPPNSSPESYSKFQSPKVRKVDHTLPPLHLDRGFRRPGDNSPGDNFPRGNSPRMNTPETNSSGGNFSGSNFPGGNSSESNSSADNFSGSNTPETNISAKTWGLERMVVITTTTENNIQPARLRNVISPVKPPVSPHGRKSDPFMPIENKLLGNQTTDNCRVQYSSESYSSPGSNDLNSKRQNGNHPKPVTVTVTSITESPVRVRVGQNDQSGRRDDLPRLTNGNTPKRTGHSNSLVNGHFMSQGSPSSDLPKWKQELREKKRLQAAKQSKTSHDKENIKTEPPANDVAEWQKRLQGIRRKWGDSETKDSNDNYKETNTAGDDSSNEKEVPSFLKEFEAKKLKQKVKVTVTAKSTASDQDKSSVNEDRKSSSKHELGTLV